MKNFKSHSVLEPEVDVVLN